MRHAKSDWSADFSSDFDRPLSKRGRKDARRMGEWLGAQEFGAISIVSSGARRARQTAKYLVKGLDDDGLNLIFEDSLYEAALPDVLELIKQHSKDVSTLLIIGHNPAMDEVYTYLSREPVVYNPDGKLLTTAAMAILGFEEVPITVAMHSAATLLLLRPKDLQG